MMLKLYVLSSPRPRVRMSAGQKVARKYRREYLRRIRRREYRRLRAIVPAIADKDNVSKVTVIEEAIKYIDHLHEALAQRLVHMGMPAQTMTQETIFNVIRQIAPPSLTSPFDFREKQAKAAGGTKRPKGSLNSP